MGLVYRVELTAELCPAKFSSSFLDLSSSGLARPNLLYCYGSFSDFPAAIFPQRSQRQ